MMGRVPRSTWMTPLQLAAVAAATGIGWGVVMALVAWLRDGSEVVLLQAWILAPAWFFGRAAGSARAGALAGLAIVGAAVFTYELLPMWGLEVALRRELLEPAERAHVALQIDRQDIALFSTLAIGALVGAGGGLRTTTRAAARRRPAPAAPPPEPPPAAPEPLWARLETAPRPWMSPEQPEPPAPAPAPAQAPEQPVDSGWRVPWGAALLFAALATDLFLHRLYDMYSDPQAGLALGFLLLGVFAAVWVARRYALAMLVAGAVLAAAFATVQHIEYDARAEPVPRAVQ